MLELSINCFECLLFSAKSLISKSACKTQKQNLKVRFIKIYFFEVGSNSCNLKSPAWKHFLRDSKNNVAKCKICQAILIPYSCNSPSLFLNSNTMLSFSFPSINWDCQIHITKEIIPYSCNINPHSLILILCCQIPVFWDSVESLQ